MKKRIFLLIPILLLTGCEKAEPISYEEAHKMYFEYFAKPNQSKSLDSLLEIGKFRMVSKNTYYDKQKDKTIKSKYVSDFSKNKLYFHDIETTDEGVIHEQWFYVKNNKSIHAIRRVNSDGDEVRQYEDEYDTERQFTEEFLARKVYIVGFLRFPIYEFLSKVGHNGDYASSGEGNLEMSYKGTIQESGISTHIDAHYKIDKYLIKSAEFSYSSNGYIDIMTGEPVESKTEMSGTLTTSKIAIVKYPNLNNYEKVG